MIIRALFSSVNVLILESDQEFNPHHEPQQKCHADPRNVHTELCSDTIMTRLNGRNTGGTMRDTLPVNQIMTKNETRLGSALLVV